MPVTISSAMPRRGRKAVIETDLDSVWGDKDITSPTDNTQPWQSSEGTLELHVPYNTYLDHQENRSAVTGRSAAVRPVTTRTPSISSVTHRSETERPSDSIAASRARPSGRSHSQSRVEPRRSNVASFEQVTPPAEASRARPASSIWTKEDYFQYISAYNANNMPNGMISPPMTEFDETPAQSYVAAPVHVKYNDDHRMGTLTPPRHTPPAEQSTVIVRPRPMRPFTPEDLLLHHSDRQSYQPTLNHFTLESMRSPLVTILSPVSESFGVESSERPQTEIFVVDSQDVLPTTSSRLSGPPQLPANIEQDDLSNPMARTTNTYAPLSTHPSTRAVRQNVANRPPLSISTAAEVRGRIGMGIDFGGLPCAPFPSSSVECKSVNDSQFKTPPIPARSTLRNQPTSAGPQSGHNSYQVTSPQTKTTPLSVTSCMRMQFPPVGTWQPIQRASPLMDTSRRVAQHRASPSLGDTGHTSSGALTLADAYPARHKRSASVEQLPSPSMLEPPIQPKSIPEDTQGPNSQHQSLDRETLELIVEAVMQRAKEEGTLMTVAQAAHYARRHASEDLDATRKQVATSTPFTVSSVEARPRTMAPESTPLDTDVQYKNIPNTTFYNEVRDDYRGLSREAWGTTEVDKSGQAGVVTSATGGKAKQKHRVRARSASRPRERLPIPDVRTGVAEQPQMVRSYSQIWM